MNFAPDIQNIEREKKLKRHEEMKEIEIPMTHKGNMRKSRPIANSKVPSQFRQNQ